MPDYKVNPVEALDREHLERLVVAHREEFVRSYLDITSPEAEDAAHALFDFEEETLHGR